MKIDLKLATAILVVSLGVSLVVGFLVGKSQSTNLDDSQQTARTAMSHEYYEVPEGVSAPAVTMLELKPDSKSGWNLHFETENFSFTPKNASTQHIEGEGHAHLHVNGEKITRLYSNYYYIAELPEGENTISVFLNTNDHKEYTAYGLGTGKVITVKN